MAGGGFGGDWERNIYTLQLSTVSLSLQFKLPVKINKVWACKCGCIETGVGGSVWMGFGDLGSGDR